MSGLDPVRLASALRCKELLSSPVYVSIYCSSPSLSFEKLNP